MSKKLIKPVGFALAAVLAVAPMALAQQSGSGMAGQTESTSPRQGSSDQPMGTSTPGTPSSQMGGMMGSQETLNATVSSVNRQQKTVRLRMQGGDTVELKLPEQSLANLQQGDSVQVSIHKAEGASGMSGTQKSKSGAGKNTGTSTAPRSHQ